MKNRQSAALELTLALFHCVTLGWILRGIVNAYFYMRISDTQYVVLSCCLSILIYMVYIVLEHSRKKKWNLITGSDAEENNWKGMPFLKALACGLLFGLLMYFIIQLLENSANCLSYAFTGELLVYPLFEPVSSLTTLIKWSILYAVMPAISEELIYRGMIVKGMARKNVIVAYLFSSIIFALAHKTIIQDAEAFMNGFVWCILYTISGSLVVPCTAHIIYNIMGIITSTAVLPLYSIFNLLRRYAERDEYIASAAGLLGVGLVLVSAAFLLIIWLRRKVSSQAHTTKHRLTLIEWMLALITLLLQMGFAVSAFLQQGVL